MGMKYAGGEYIGFVDSDDYIETDMYEKLYARAVENGADLTECNFFWEYPSRQKPDKGKMYDLENMLTEARVVPWNKIIKREVIEKHDLRFPPGLKYEDIEFFYKLVPHINSIGYVREPLYHYVQRKTSSTYTVNEKTGDIFKILENVLTYYKGNGFYESFKERLEYRFIRFLLGSSLLRMARIEDKQLGKRLLKENWNYLNTAYPAWKKNKILAKRWTLKDICFKTVNRFTYIIYTELLHLILKFSGTRN
jgi:glycosyltransferase involved in cell wall biosynthesis